MTKYYKAAIIAVAAALASQAAQASQTPLELGFTKSGSSDLIIDLGSVSSLIGQTSVVDLSGDFNATTFNNTFGSATGVSMAVVSGNPTFGQYDLYATQVRTGGAGNAAVAGSDLTSQGHSTSQISGGAATLTGNLAWPTTTGQGVVDSTLTYSTKVEASTASSMFGKTGVQAAGTIDNTGTIYEDLWFATPSQAYTYEGYFTFNDNTGSLTFTSADVVTAPIPEPATYGVFAGFGLLALALRRQISRKNA